MIANLNSSFSLEQFQKAPIVGIIRGLSKEDTFNIAMAYQAAGLYTLEITMNTKGATKMIAQLNHEFPDLCIGAGTVCTLSELMDAIEAGAQFIVTPIINEEVIKKSVDLGIPIFPGAFTPSEIYKAWSLGATAIKVFPAAQLGPSYIKNILAPLNNIKLLPTGGISKENMKSFFDAGAIGVGMGSSLLNKKLIKEKDFDGLQEHLILIKEKALNIS